MGRTLPERMTVMSRDHAALTRMKQTGENYSAALEAVQTIRAYRQDTDCTWAEATAWYDNPANKVACTTCGWTYGMLCPECPGCGCYNFTCSGWRHQEFMDEEDLAQLHACPECGGDTRNNYDCRCGE